MHIENIGLYMPFPPYYSNRGCLLLGLSRNRRSRQQRLTLCVEVNRTNLIHFGHVDAVTVLLAAEEKIETKSSCYENHCQNSHNLFMNDGARTDRSYQVGENGTWDRKPARQWIPAATRGSRVGGEDDRHG